MWPHIVLLAVIPIGVPVLAAKHWGRPTVGRIVLAVILTLLTVFASLVVGVHDCGRGAPLLQWVIPSTAMLVALLCIAPAALRRVTATALALVSIGLSGHFAGRVHADDVVGTTDARCTKATALWHTPLTGFYAAEPTECEPRQPRRK
jgi:hypothetical protein